MARRYTKQKKLMPHDLYDEYGLGGWLKENAGTALSIAGGVTSALPFPGARAIGAGLTGVGGAVQTHLDAKEQEEQLRTENIKPQRMKRRGMYDKQIRSGYDPITPMYSMGGRIPRSRPQPGQQPMDPRMMGPEQGQQPMDPRMMGPEQGMPMGGGGQPAFMEYSGQQHTGPDGGIPVDKHGNPAVVSGQRVEGLVEDEENVYVAPDGDVYVFSKELGYADKARKIVNKYKKRLGENLDKQDNIAQKGLEKELERLIEAQEEERMRMMQKEQQRMEKQMRREQQREIEEGADIEGQPQHRESPNMEFGPGDVLSPETEIMYEYGGYLEPSRATLQKGINRDMGRRIGPGDIGGIRRGLESPTPYVDRRKRTDMLPASYTRAYPMLRQYGGPLRTTGTQAGQAWQWQGPEPIAEIPTEGGPRDEGLRDMEATERSPAERREEAEDAAREGLYEGIPSALPALATAGANVAGLLLHRRDKRRRDPIRAPLMAPGRIDLSRPRQAVQERGAATRATTRRHAARAGLGPTAYATVAGTGTAEIDRGVSEQLADLYTQEEMANLEAGRQAQQANMQALIQQQEMEMQMDLMDEEVRRRYIDNILGTIPGYARDVTTGRQQAHMASMQSDYYDLVSERREPRILDYILGQKSPRTVTTEHHRKQTQPLE